MKNGFFSWLMVAGLALTFFGCDVAQDMIKDVVQTPSVSLSDIAVTGISSSRLDLSTKLSIDNPNPVGLSLSSLDYEFELADSPLFSGISDQGLDIRPSGMSLMKIPISLGYEDVKRVYDSVRGQDEVPYRFSGKMSVDTPIGPIPIPFDLKGKLPVVRPPKIKSVDLKVSSLSLSKAKLVLNIKLYNPNNFPLDILKAGYALSLDGRNFSEGGIQAGKVSPKSDGSLKVPLTIDMISLGSWAYSLLSGSSADYELSYDAKYKIKDWPVKQREKKAGTLRIR